MKEQIEEMTKVLKGMDRFDEAKFGFYESYAQSIYNAGYRKQKEGEWITSDIPQEKYVCSVCGGACWYYDYQGYVAKSKYCPNCGAKMKGGAE
jgi:rubrerythrin